MERQKVVSSDLNAVGYDAVAQVLEVEFRSGAVYRYKGVGLATYTALRTAPSIGKYFYHHIRSQYPCQRLPDKSRSLTLPDGERRSASDRTDTDLVHRSTGGLNIRPTRKRLVANFENRVFSHVETFTRQTIACLNLIVSVSKVQVQTVALDATVLPECLARYGG